MNAACSACDWTATGKKADTLAAQHTKDTGHPTLTHQADWTDCATCGHLGVSHTTHGPCRAVGCGCAKFREAS